MFVALTDQTVQLDLDSAPLFSAVGFVCLALFVAGFLTLVFGGKGVRILGNVAAVVTVVGTIGTPLFFITSDVVRHAEVTDVIEEVTDARIVEGDVADIINGGTAIFTFDDGDYAKAYVTIDNDTLTIDPIPQEDA